MGDFFWSVIGEAIDVKNDELCYWAFLEREDDWLLLLLDDEVRLVLFVDSDAEIRLLGHLKGNYVERISEEGSRRHIELRFDDERLPDGKITFEEELESRIEVARAAASAVS